MKNKLPLLHGKKRKLAIIQALVIMGTDLLHDRIDTAHNKQIC